MSFNSFGRVFRFTTWGESHGPAIGAVVDGCPPGLPLTEADIQPWLDLRKPGTSKFTTQRREADLVRILSGVFEGRTTGTPISLMIENTDQRSKDYSDVAKAYRPGHADYAYDAKYGFRDYRGGGRSSATRSTTPISIRRRSVKTPSSARTGKPPSVGRHWSTPRASMVRPWARSSNAWHPACRRDGGRRSMPSWTANWPPR